MNNSTNTTTALSLAELLFEEASQSLPSSLSQVSNNVILIWDIIITYDQEIELIWWSRHCIVNYLFFFIRYGALSQGIISLVLLLNDFKTKHNICRLYSWYYVCSSITLLCSVDLLLIYRAFAFYARDRRVFVGLVICWLVNSGALLVIAMFLGIGFPITHSTALSIYGIKAECQELRFPRLLNYFWISELIFQSILFLLISIRFFKQSIVSWNGTEGISTVYFVFIRDGIWAYFLLFGLFVASVTLTKLVDISLSLWAVNFTAITATRLILNLRSLKPSHSSPATEGYSMSLPKWVGGKVCFDTISESTSDITLSQGDVVELQNMGRVNS